MAQWNARVEFEVGVAAMPEEPPPLDADADTKLVHLSKSE